MSRVSHIAQTLSMPGFIGYPSKNDRQLAYGDGSNRPSPYGDLSLDIVTVPTIVRPRLTTGRIFSGDKAPKTDVFNYSSRRETPGVYPQSVPSSQTGFATNAETAIFPNETPMPVMIGMLEAQIAAMKQEEDARMAVVSSIGAQADASEIVERLKSPAELYFEAERKKIDAKELMRLQAAGYTEDDIADFINQRRRAGMAAAAQRQDPEDDIFNAVALMQGGMPQTGTNAVGIGALSAARVRRDMSPETTAEMLDAMVSAMGTGGSVASVLQGASDPRASISSAARRENGLPTPAMMAGAAAKARARGAVSVAPTPVRVDIASMMGIVSQDRERGIGGGLDREGDVGGGGLSAAGGGGGAAAGGGGPANYSVKDIKKIKSAARRAVGAPKSGKIPKTIEPLYVAELKKRGL